MPQPLARPQPTSSVAAMLDRGVGAALITSAPSVVQAATPLPAKHPAEPSLGAIPRQFLLSPAADEVLKRLQAVFAAATGLELRQSELLRALLSAMALTMPAVEREAGRAGPLRRPKNARGNEAAQAALEQRVAAIIRQALAGP